MLDAPAPATARQKWAPVLAGCLFIVAIQVYMYASSGGAGSELSQRIIIRCPSSTQNTSQAQAQAISPSPSPSECPECPSPPPCPSVPPPPPLSQVVSHEPIVLYVDDLNPDIEGLQSLRARYDKLLSWYDTLHHMLKHDETWTDPFTSQEIQQLQECNKLVPHWKPPAIQQQDIQKLTTQQIHPISLYVSYANSWPSGSSVLSSLNEAQKKISEQHHCIHIIDKHNVVALEPIRAYRRSVDGDRRFPTPTAGLAKPDTTLPIIAVTMSSTTRGLTITDKTQLALFSTTLPSFARYAEPGFEYWIYVTYDQYDPYYDVPDPGRISELHTWFNDNVAKPLKDKGIHSRFILTPFENMLRKPGPAFNFVTRQAYLDGATYIYRINDDSEMLTPFASSLVSRVSSCGPPYCAVGPTDNNNARILTHDFIHRTHHEIFTSHYPPVLTDWWLDDWMSLVYGPSRTHMVSDVKVHNRGPARSISNLSMRYDVDWNREQSLKVEVYRGRLAIMKYVRDHKLDETEQQKQEWSNFRKLWVE